LQSLLRLLRGNSKGIITRLKISRKVKIEVYAVVVSVIPKASEDELFIKEKKNFKYLPFQRSQNCETKIKFKFFLTKEKWSKISVKRFSCSSVFVKVPDQETA